MEWTELLHSALKAEVCKIHLKNKYMQTAPACSTVQQTEAQLLKPTVNQWTLNVEPQSGVFQSVEQQSAILIGENRQGALVTASSVH